MHCRCLKCALISYRSNGYNSYYFSVTFPVDHLESQDFFHCSYRERTTIPPSLRKLRGNFVINSRIKGYPHNFISHSDFSLTDVSLFWGFEAEKCLLLRRPVRRGSGRHQTSTIFTRSPTQVAPSTQGRLPRQHPAVPSRVRRTTPEACPTHAPPTTSLFLSTASHFHCFFISLHMGLSRFHMGFDFWVLGVLGIVVFSYWWER